MKTVTVEKKIDYLSFTITEPKLFDNDTVMDEIRSPIPNYNRCVRHMSGMLHLWHDLNRDMKHHYILSGQTLDVKRSLGLHEREFLKHVLHHGHVSRIDIAITSQYPDEQQHQITPDDIVTEIMAGNLKSRLKPAKEISENRKVQTKYIGNQKKRYRLFRAYDKGLDLGLEVNKLIRFELETRRGGNILSGQIVKGLDYGAIMRRYVDFPNNPHWLGIMNAPSAIFQHLEPPRDALDRKVDKNIARWHWLTNSVAKTVATALMEDYDIAKIDPYDNENYMNFVRTIFAEVDRNSRQV